MNKEEKKDTSITTFAQVIVNKNDLLKKLENNRDNHNAIYDAAVSGYWIQATQVVKKKQEDFNYAIKRVKDQFKSESEEIAGFVTDQNKYRIGRSFAVGLVFDSLWPLRFPENHLEDYDRVIDMLKFSVADKVELSSTDFDAYVRNNWAWRSSYLSSNSNYVSLAFCSGNVGVNVTGCMIGNIAISGCASPTNVAKAFNNFF